MERIDSDGILIWQCPSCKSNESISLKETYSAKHIKNRRSHLEEKAKDIVDYLPIFQNLVKALGDLIERYPELKEDTLTRFRRYEKLAKKDLLAATECFFIGHYDPTKKSKKKWCYINKDQLAQMYSLSNKR